VVSMPSNLGSHIERGRIIALEEAKTWSSPRKAPADLWQLHSKASRHSKPPTPGKKNQPQDSASTQIRGAPIFVVATNSNAIPEAEGAAAMRLPFRASSSNAACESRDPIATQHLTANGLPDNGARAGETAHSSVQAEEPDRRNTQRTIASAAAMRRYIQDSTLASTTLPATQSDTLTPKGPAASSNAAPTNNSPPHLSEDKEYTWPYGVVGCEAEEVRGGSQHGSWAERARASERAREREREVNEVKRERERQLLSLRRTTRSPALRMQAYADVR
jgi:hypothetical protein